VGDGDEIGVAGEGLMADGFPICRDSHCPAACMNRSD
jgi:hypothetical protein